MKAPQIMDMITALPKYKLKKNYGLVTAPVPVKEKLEQVLADYKPKIEALQAQLDALKQEQNKALLDVTAELKEYPGLLPTGLRFMLWHRVAARRMEVAIKRVTVRRFFELWELCYVITDDESNEQTIDAGQLEEIEPAAPTTQEGGEQS